MNSNKAEAKPDLHKLLTEGAARVASEGNGLPLSTFVTLAEHVLSHLVCYAPDNGPLLRQDINYLARNLQSVYANLQDYQGDVP